MIHNCCSWFHCHLLHGSNLETIQLSKNRVTTVFMFHLFFRHPRQRFEKLTVYEHATLWHPFLFCRLRPHHVDMKLFHELIRPALVKNCLIWFLLRNWRSDAFFDTTWLSVSATSWTRAVSSTSGVGWMLDTLTLGKPLGIAQNYRVKQQLRTLGSV